MQNEQESTDKVAKRKLFRRVAIGVSVLFHIVLVAALAVWYVNRPQTRHAESVADASNTAPTGPTQPNPPRPSPDVTSEQVNNTLDRMQEKFEAAPEEEQLSSLEEKAAELEKLASAESIDEIAEKFEQWGNILQRAF